MAVVVDLLLVDLPIIILSGTQTYQVTYQASPPGGGVPSAVFTEEVESHTGEELDSMSSGSGRNVIQYQALHPLPGGTASAGRRCAGCGLHDSRGGHSHAWG